MIAPYSALEKEADVMGEKSLEMKAGYHLNNPAFSNSVPNTVDPIQRKILLKGSLYTPDPDENASPEVEEAIGDEFLRYYESKGEALGHIDSNVPGNFGLIKSRALWYRMPYLNDRFFVFGEYHSAVKGSQIKAASNITKTILDEERTGWTVEEFGG